MSRIMFLDLYIPYLRNCSDLLCSYNATTYLPTYLLHTIPTYYYCYSVRLRLY